MSWQDAKILSQLDIDNLNDTELPSQFQLGQDVVYNVAFDGSDNIVQLPAVVSGVHFRSNGVHYDLAFKIAPGFYAQVAGFRGWITKPGELPDSDGGLTLVSDLEDFIKTAFKPVPGLRIVGMGAPLAMENYQPEPDEPEVLNPIDSAMHWAPTNKWVEWYMAKYNVKLTVATSEGVRRVTIRRAQQA